MADDIYISAAPEDEKFASAVSFAVGQMGLSVAPAGPASVQTARLVLVIWSQAGAADTRVALEAPLAAYRSVLLLARLDATAVPGDQRSYLLDLSKISDGGGRLIATLKRVGEMLDLSHTAADIELISREALAEPVARASVVEPPVELEDVEVAHEAIAHCRSSEAEENVSEGPPRAMFVIRPSEEGATNANVSSLPLALIAALTGACCLSLMYSYTPEDYRNPGLHHYFAMVAADTLMPIVGAIGVVLLSLRLIPVKYGRKAILRTVAVMLVGLLFSAVLAVGLGILVNWTGAESWLGSTGGGKLSDIGLEIGLACLFVSAWAVTAGLLIAMAIMRFAPGAALPLHRSRVMSLAGIATLLFVTVAQSGEYSKVARLSLDQDIENQLARVGWKVHAGVPGQSLTDRIKAFQSANALAPNGKTSDELLVQLAERPDKRDWNIRPDGTGDARTIAEAFSRRGLDGVINLSAGTYQECPEFNGSGLDTPRFTLRGAGANTVIVCDGSAFAKAATARPKSRDIFADADQMEAYDAADEPPAAAAATEAAAAGGNAAIDAPTEPIMPMLLTLGSGDRLEHLVVKQSSAKVGGTVVDTYCAKSEDESYQEDCKLPPTIEDVIVENNGSGYAISIGGDMQSGRRSAVLDRVTLSGGILVGEGTNPLIDNSRFPNADHIGIQLAKSDVLIRGSTFEGTGIRADGPGGTVENCRFSGFRSSSAIAIGGSGNLTVRTSQFSRSPQSNAFWIYENGKATIENNSFFDLDGTAILIDGKADVTVRANRFDRLYDSAVWAAKSSKVAIIGNQIRGSNTADFYVIGGSGSAGLEITGNRIDMAGRVCIGVRGEATAQISDNTLIACSSTAVEYDRTATAKLGRNQIAPGLLVKQL